MKPVEQTILTPPHGNCHAACVASILELPIDRVPNVNAAERYDEGWARFLGFLKSMGLGVRYVEREAGDADDWPGWHPDGYWIATHDNAVPHATVWLGDRLVWNPLPSTPLNASDFGHLVCVEWFECLDPALTVRGLGGRWRRVGGA